LVNWGKSSGEDIFSIFEWKFWATQAGSVNDRKPFRNQNSKDIRTKGIKIEPRMRIMKRFLRVI
jgi:hypothetical protein